MYDEVAKNDMVPRKSRLFCCKEKIDTNIFFSLIDYRNNYFTSDNPNKIVEFYNDFENREQLIEWMKERPKGANIIKEVEGEKDIIVVIPTADFNGKYAKECRDNIFNGLHIVFVESGGKSDFYFNYAHNCNVGIKKAMEYNPKWVIVSNDDMYKEDEVGVLKDKLSQLNNEDVDLVACETTYGYHSTPVKIVFLNKIGLRLYSRRFRKNRINLMPNFVKRMSLNFIFTPVNKSKRNLVKITKMSMLKQNIFTKIFFHDTGIRMIQIGAFEIFSSNLINKLKIDTFNEDYINAVEDIDLSYRILT